MNWMILGAALLIVLIPIVVLRLRKAARTLDAIMSEHHERMAEQPAPTGTTARRGPARHRRHGRRPRTERVPTGYATHRRMSA